MANVKVVPTLGEDGYLKDPNDKVATQFLYALTSKYSQASTYVGSVTSIEKILKDNLGDPDGMARDLEYNLTKMYQRLFSTVEVSARSEDGSIYVSVKATDDQGLVGELVTSINSSDGAISMYEDMLAAYYS